MDLESTLGDVVVGTDFMRHSHEAAARAAWLPISPGSTITLVHAVPPGLPAVVETQVRAATGALLEGERAALAVEAERARLSNVEVLASLHEGRPVEVLAERAHHGRATLLVVGRGQRRGVGEHLLGSVAERVVHAASCNVLIVGAPPERPYRSAVVGVDTTGNAARVVEAAARLVPPEALTVVHAYDAPFADMARDLIPPPMTPADLRSYLADTENTARAQLAGQGVGVDPLVLRGDARQILLAQAAERKADLIVVGHHDRTVLGRLVLGSVAAAVVRRAACDVLVVH